MMIPSTALAILSLLSATQAATTKTILSPDDVIVLAHDGSSRVMKAAEFEALEAKQPAPAAPVSETTSVPAARSIRRRGCEKSTEIQVISDEEFLNWDVAISPVLSSTGGKGTVSVSSGYSISNSISVGSSLSVGSIDQILGVSLSVEYSESWSSSQEQSLTFEVPDGKHGVIVSQPYVRRVQGFVLDGCTDNPEKTAFTCDSYEDQAYGNLSWVKGLIKLCSSETYPIPYCIGEGVHK
ncbi:hypothetical protein ACJ41O_014516 [Fusarium nematophilum]